VSAAPLFLVPLSIEARAVARGAKGADIQRIGMGPVKATATRVRVAPKLESRRPIVLIGLGGGLVEGMTPGDIVVASVLQATNGAPEVPLQSAGAVADLLRRASLPVRVAPVVSSPKIISGPEDRAAAASHGAIAVDMESFWCAPLAVEHPFAVVRVLLDLPEYEIFSPRLPRTIGRAWRSLVGASRALATWTPTTLNVTAQTEVGEA
jgi:4-hydroxy-3-methylbut-2-enyl diphosphate reductase